MVHGLIVLWCVSGFGAPAHALKWAKYTASDDPAALRRGAMAFKTHCAACHALSLATHDPYVREAGLIPMPVHPPGSWDGHPPPDLSLVTRSRGGAWVKTLLTYYEDRSQSPRFNNLVHPQTSMPNPFVGLQGIQRCKLTWWVMHRSHGFV